MRWKLRWRSSVWTKRNTGARVIQSAALMGQQKFGEARQVLEKVLKAEPGLADVNFQLGAVNLADKKYAEAEAAFRRAYQLNPADARGLMGVAKRRSRRTRRTPRWHCCRRRRQGSQPG